MIQKACIDRFEGQQAVLLVDEKPLVFPKSSLPKKAREGDWLNVEISGGQLVMAKIDQEETEKAVERIKEKLAKLRRGGI
jgi:hypothetical protein